MNPYTRILTRQWPTFFLSWLVPWRLCLIQHKNESDSRQDASCFQAQRPVVHNHPGNPGPFFQCRQRPASQGRSLTSVLVQEMAWGIFPFPTEPISAALGLLSKHSPVVNASTYHLKDDVPLALWRFLVSPGRPNSGRPYKSDPTLAFVIAFLPEFYRHSMTIIHPLGNVCDPKPTVAIFRIRNLVAEHILPRTPVITLGFDDFALFGRNPKA